MGKTTLAALLIDETVQQYPGPILVVDGDPAMSLHLALGLPPPPATLANIREETKLDAQSIRNLPEGMSPAQFIAMQLQQREVITRHYLHGLRLHYLALGQGEGPGCYCRINQILTQVLTGLTTLYPLILIDNEAGVEHLSRYRLQEVDLFIVVNDATRASQETAQRILFTAREVGMSLGEVITIFNRVTRRPFSLAGEETSLEISEAFSVHLLGLNGQPVTDLKAYHPVRQGLQPIVKRILACV